MIYGRARTTILAKVTGNPLRIGDIIFHTMRGKLGSGEMLTHLNLEGMTGGVIWRSQAIVFYFWMRGLLGGQHHDKFDTNEGLVVVEMNGAGLGRLGVENNYGQERTYW